MLQEIIILTALYVLIIGILYAPKCPAKTATETAINYFPNVEESPTLTPSSESLESSEMAIAVTIPPAPSLDFHSLSIRTLKKLASERKIPRYSNLTKAQLIAVLA